jgi:hypothetical protein
VVRERDAARAEIAEHRRRLESVQSIIQPILHSGLNDLATAAGQNPLPARLPLPHEAASHLPTRAQDQHVAHPHNGVHSPAETEPNRQWLLPGDAPTSHIRHWSGENSHFDHPPPQLHQMSHGMPLDGRMGVNFVLDNGQGAAVDPNLPPPPSQAPRDGGSLGQYAPELVPHLTMPKTIQPTCQLDVIMLDFLSDCRHRAGQGVPLQVLAGPMYPNFTALVSPNKMTEPQTLSRLFRRHPDVPRYMPAPRAGCRRLRHVPHYALANRANSAELRPPPILGNADTDTAFRTSSLLDKSSTLATSPRPPHHSSTIYIIQRVLRPLHDHCFSQLALQCT